MPAIVVLVVVSVVAVCCCCCCCLFVLVLVLGDVAPCFFYDADFHPHYQCVVLCSFFWCYVLVVVVVVVLVDVSKSADSVCRQCLPWIFLVLLIALDVDRTRTIFCGTVADSALVHWLIQRRDFLDDSAKVAVQK